MGSLYIRKHFNKDSKKEVEEMVTNIQSEFIQSLMMYDWMDENAKYEAIEKVNSMFVHVGYADELLDEKRIEKHYLSLDIVSDNYLETMLSISLFNRDYNYKQLRDAINRTDWTKLKFPTVVDAYYSFQKNSIEFPAGILQGLFFDNNRPRYMNYGGIGSIIGHEVMHGFDDQGRQYDGNGNIAEWWTLETKDIIAERSKCITDQYEDYFVPEVGVNLDGISIREENIADSGGIKQAYLAYQTWVDQNGPEKRLPGLPYTPNQMFWISAANVWCTKYPNEFLKLKIRTGSNLFEKYRVLGTFSNMEYFSDDFKCSLGSNMNPQHKCQVW
ncbi:hypothetical protein ILUMI_22555 [Ignelater luminosus]|uniref:Neprilysin n=1 Tax=Ignelater luminosus TaxID=2038154 RepID=A0A8K0G2H9_IGNLU|nr:hypothetical protein ILUMI_22555 [Ignelater luminosus]